MPELRERPAATRDGAPRAAAGDAPPAPPRGLGPALLAHVETWRPYTLFYAGLVSVAGALLALDAPSAWTLLGAWAAPTLGWLAALYGGDWFDRELDAAAKPQRPIPSGRLAPRTALGAMAVAIALGVVVAAALNPLTLAVVAVTLAAGVAYSSALKSRGVLGNVVRGGLTALAFAFGTMAGGGLPPLELLPLAIVFLLHDACTNLVGAVRDVAGDRRGGCRTLPVRHGVARARALAATLYGAALGLAVAWPLLALDAIDAGALAAALLVTAVLGLAALVPVCRAAADAVPAAAGRAHRIFVVERLALAVAFVAAAGAAGAAIAAFAAAAVATVVLQSLLRGRHEAPPAQQPATVDGAAITAFVDDALARIAAAPGAMRSLGGWSRRIEIAVADVELELVLLAGDGELERVAAGTADDGRRRLRIGTDSETFADIFLRGRTNPRRAFLLGRITIAAAAGDLPRLNGLFNEFRRLGAAARPRLEVVGEPQPAGAAAPPPGLSPSIVLSDTTLRDGEQMPGMAFAVHDKVAIALGLDALGVPIIEAGFPIVSREEAQAVREIVALRLDAVIQVIARPLPGDVDAAVASGAHSIALFVGTSDAHVEGKLRTTRAALVAQVLDAVAYAKSSGCQVVFAAEDATRSERGFLLDVYRAATAAGADAVGIADTAGVAVPAQIAALVHDVSDATDVPVAIHCHDDLGLATANSLAGLLAGASGVQCSVLGIGERAGNAALEELVMALEVAYDYRTGLRLVQLPRVAELVARALGQPLPPNKPVVGANAFVHESGLHLDGVMRDPRTYEPFPPELVGAQRRFTFGKHSGRGAIAEVLGRHAVGLDDARLGRLVDAVKQRGQARAPLDEAALVQLAREVA